MGSCMLEIRPNGHKTVNRAKPKVALTNLELVKAKSAFHDSLMHDSSGTPYECLSRFKALRKTLSKSLYPSIGTR
jgi:hypothetical protein